MSQSHKPRQGIAPVTCETRATLAELGGCVLREALTQKKSTHTVLQEDAPPPPTLRTSLLANPLAVWGRPHSSGKLSSSSIDVSADEIAKNQREEHAMHAKVGKAPPPSHNGISHRLEGHSEALPRAGVARPAAAIAPGVAARHVLSQPEPRFPARAAPHCCAGHACASQSCGCPHTVNVCSPWSQEVSEC